MTRLRLPPVADPLPRLRLTARRAGWLAAAALAAAVGWEAVRVLGLSNRHVVIPGRVYRSAQPTAADIRDLVARYGIRTVVNLRGRAADHPWYRAEAEAAHAADACQEDVTLSAYRLPSPSELRRLVEVLDRTEHPVLIHCKRGADRTGLASAVALLLHTDAAPDVARRQLWPVRGHFRFGRTAAIDDFFDRYERWLTDTGQPHAPARFRHWATAVYVPGPARSRLEWLDPMPDPVPSDRPFRVRLRATNLSAEAWELKPGNYAGVHLAYLVARSPTEAAYRGQAGLLRATVRPGGHVDFTVAVPPLRRPGRYVLAAELTDATGCGVPIRSHSFVQLGDEAILAEVAVGP